MTSWPPERLQTVSGAGTRSSCTNGRGQTHSDLIPIQMLHVGRSFWHTAGRWGAWVLPCCTYLPVWDWTCLTCSVFSTRGTTGAELKPLLNFYPFTFLQNVTHINNIWEQLGHEAGAPGSRSLRAALRVSGSRPRHRPAPEQTHTDKRSRLYQCAAQQTAC